MLDPFCVKSLPSESQLNLWKDEIGKNKGGQWQYMETSVGRLDINCTNNLLKLHTEKGNQAAQEQKINWFSRTYSKPHTLHVSTPTSKPQTLYVSTPTSFIDNKLPCIFLAVFDKSVLGRALNF